VRRRQAKKIVHREAARYLAVAVGAENTGHVDPHECGVLTLGACVSVLGSDVATLRGLRRQPDEAHLARLRQERRGE
jgi:hypothetical protein